jgi:hypothetical protein
LRPILELDFLFQMHGRRWADASDEEFAAYERSRHRASRWSDKHGEWVMQQRALAQKLGDAYFARDP